MPKFIIALLISLLFAASPKTYIPDSKRAVDARAKVWPKLQTRIKGMGLKDGGPVYLRLFKDNHILELWMLADKKYKLFDSYIICSYSGGLGTKTKNGDSKCPEGYYEITPASLNPMSTYHLAMNIGYPNEFDRQHGYTGSEIMIHGNCVSIGCYAMTDPQIEEIYTLVYQAFAHGQKSIPISIFPCKLTNKRLDAYSEWPNVTFWKGLKQGYDIFEHTHIPPAVTVVNKNYSFR